MSPDKRVLLVSIIYTLIAGLFANAAAIAGAGSPEQPDSGLTIPGVGTIERFIGMGGLLVGLVIALKHLISEQKAQQARSEKREEELRAKLESRDTEIKELLKAQHRT